MPGGQSSEPEAQGARPQRRKHPREGPAWAVKLQWLNKKMSVGIRRGALSAGVPRGYSPRTWPIPAGGEAAR
jgi:hypothetical protein